MRQPRVGAAGGSIRRRARPFHLVRLGSVRIGSARAGILAVLTAFGVLLVSGCGPEGTLSTQSATGPADRPSASDPTIQSGTLTSPGANLSSAGPDRLPAGTSLVATAHRATVTVRTSPAGTVKQALANPTADGAPLTFLVLQAQPDWLRVSLPVRPNGSSGWVRRSDVGLSLTPYRLVISRSAHRLDVLYEGHRQARYPVGVGTVATPTPPGTYYLTELIQPPDPGGAYGPYAFGLSAFSTTLKSFAGGPGQLGLHGTDAPNGLGHDVSHGCLRVANSVITKLAAELPLGTPIDIQS